MVFDAVAHGDVDLGVLGRDAKDAGQPHPEDGARAAGDDRRGNAYDGARSDGAGEGRDQGAKLTDVAFGPLILHDRHLDGLPEPALREPEAAGEKHVRAEKQGNHHWPPHGTVYLVE